MSARGGAQRLAAVDGTPPQTVRVFASTTVPETWVVSTEGCVEGGPTGCKDSRGQLFSSNASSTWKNVDVFELGVESNLRNYTSNWDHGNYGFDTLSLGYLGAGGPTIENTVIAGIATKDYYLGSIGLSSQTINFTTYDNPPPSLLSNLKTKNLIPSLSYGYSAGAPYRLKKVLGSLTLGGYDASRRPPNDTFTIALSPDVSRDLVVGLQSIEFSDAKTAGRQLLSEGIYTFIDSTVPHIWLPLDACRAFENAFGLTYDSATDLYLINSTLHDTLKQQNASVSFIIGNSIQQGGGASTNITFPYASFDLQLDPSPIVPEPRRYFPLRRADNDTQYTLGRTFLQETYLTVDYERSRFSVSQATFTDGIAPDLISISSPNNATSSTTTTSTANNHLSRAALAGTVAGAIIFFFAIIAAATTFFLYTRRRRRRRRTQQMQQQKIKEPETNTRNTSNRSIIGGELNVEFGDGKYRPPEIEGSPVPRGHLVEVQGTLAGTEIQGSGAAGVELPGGGNGCGGVVAEMDGGCGGRVELEAARGEDVFELPAAAGGGEEEEGKGERGPPRSESGQERIRVARLARLRRRGEEK
ncbi:MAG: hypothetical protein Q9186_002663 [Xanthomendoza sp. 1 TL-2023]